LSATLLQNPKRIEDKVRDKVGDKGVDGHSENCWSASHYDYFTPCPPPVCRMVGTISHSGDAVKDNLRVRRVWFPALRQRSLF
jgi:hypothetical protein